MSREEFNTIRRSFGMTLAEIASFLGTTPHSARRWSAGIHPVPHPVATLLRLMVRFEFDPAKVRKWTAEPKAGEAPQP